MKIGLVPGRFAPLHKGHQKLIECALKEMDKVYVMIYKTDVIDIPISKRAEWIKKIYPEVNIIEANDGPDGRKFAYENGKEAEDIQNKYIVHKLNGIKVTHVYSGTFYGESVAKALEAENKYISIDLESLPVSGTKIRNSPYEYKDFMEEFVFDEYIKSRKGDNNE